LATRQICPPNWDIVEKKLYQVSVVRFQRHSTFLSDFHALKNGRTIDVKITCNAYFFLAGAHCTGLVQLSAQYYRPLNVPLAATAQSMYPK
jgi:hypothetical protein